MTSFKHMLLTSACAALTAAPAMAMPFDIPGGDLKSALDAYAKQAGVSLIVSADAVRGAHTGGIKADVSADAALSRILTGTGFTTRKDSGAIVVLHSQSSENDEPVMLQLAQASSVARPSVETVTVTSSKLGGADVQSVPIAITALSQEQLTSQQIAGGPDLVKSVPNLTFTKTNFTGYSIQIRGIGTQAISVTTDPAVAVAFNDTPFIRNHFFEQEFFDVSQVEVLRGPQGTLYGRNATAGVVNVVSAKPTDHYEAQASVDVGNYNKRRLEGMINIPVIGDKLDIRAAGEWTKRDGYDFNETTDQHIDGRDLWSGRISVAFKPVERLRTNFVWEHFNEDDDRARSTKQLCKKDSGPNTIDGFDINTSSDPGFYKAWLSQGCLPASFYSPESFQTPNGQSIPFVAAGQFIFNGFAFGGTTAGGFALNQIDPYASITQSTDLRTIQSQINPTYKARSDLFELNTDFDISPSLTLTSQTAYNKDRLASTEDFNRFNTSPGLFSTAGPGGGDVPVPAPNGVYCDPQLGCSTSMVGEDLSQERAWQFSQEVRLASNFSGPFNFTAGGNYMHYQTVEDYYVFFNLITLEEQLSNLSGPGDFTNCYTIFDRTPYPVSSKPFFLDVFGDGNLSAFPGVYGCDGHPEDPTALPGNYIDPNPIIKSQRPWSQLFPQREPLSPEFHRWVRRSLLPGYVGRKNHRRPALDG